MSVGGVIGGGFNAFLAPLIFPRRLGISDRAGAVLPGEAVERGPLHWREAALSAIGLGCALFAVSINQMWGYGVIQTPKDLFLAKMLEQGPRLIFTVTPVCAFLLRDRALYFAGLILAVVVGSQNLTIREQVLGQARSFFGVLRVTRNAVPGYANNVRELAHGTTLHGAQAMDATNPCVPMTYYAPETPIGQVFLTTGAAKRNMAVGAVGMGAGSVAAYARPDDEYRFYEIDPTVVAISGNGQFFTYISQCAKSRHLDWVIGDARLTLSRSRLASSMFSWSTPFHPTLCPPTC